MSGAEIMALGVLCFYLGVLSNWVVDRMRARRERRRPLSSMRVMDFDEFRRRYGQHHNPTEAQRRMAAPHWTRDPSPRPRRRAS